MVSLTTAEKALKDYYLGVVAEQLNTGVNPFLAKIAQTSADVWGKQIVKMVPYGVNGGVGAGTETGALPTAAGNNYERFTLDLKNLYGRIEISDKAMRASLSTEGAFVNLLNAEMEGLLKASKFNLGRMLFGDGSGKLATLSAATASATKTLTVDDTRNLTEGMVVDIVSAEGTPKSGMTGLRITAVDRTGKSVTFDKGVTGSIVATDFLTVQGSYKNEITGLKAIFASSGTLYGLNKSDYKWLTPKTHTVSALTLEKMQEAIDGGSVAEAAVDHVCTLYADMFAGMEDELMRQRSADVQDIRTRMLGILLGEEAVDLSTLPAGSVLIAHDLTPSMTVGLKREKIAAILTETGGKTSHSAILARALEVPAVLSIPDVLSAIADGAVVIADGSAGEIIVDPDFCTINAYEEKR